MAEGLADMKGELATMVAVTVRMADIYGPKARLILIITAGEETGCQVAYHLATSISYIVSIGTMVISEPISNYPFIDHKGVLWLQAQASGIAAHGSQSEKGANAIFKAAEAILRQ
jgi:succinyl-diaminopimelate desuccinylase